MTSKTKTRTGTKVPKQAGDRTGGEIIDADLSTLPLIDGENTADYQAFREECLRAVQPKDAIERVWLQDFVDYQWEVQRVRRLKGALLHGERRDAMERILIRYIDEDSCCGNASTWETAKWLAHQWSAGEVDVVDEVMAVLKRHGLSLDTVMANALTLRAEDIERIDRLLGFYEHRRDAALRELEKRRDVLPRRARDFADAQVIDVEPQALPAAE